MNNPLLDLAAREAVTGTRDLRDTIHQRWLAGFVRRWHANPHLHHLHDYNQGHAGRVAVIGKTLWPDWSQEALWAALTHDMGEGVGDLPGNAKRRYTALSVAMETAEADELHRLGIRHSATDREWQQIKFCDRLDAYKVAAYFAPQCLTERDWIEARAWIETRAAEYGVRVI